MEPGVFIYWSSWAHWPGLKARVILTMPPPFLGAHSHLWQSEADSLILKAYFFFDYLSYSYFMLIRNSNPHILFRAEMSDCCVLIWLIQTLLGWVASFTDFSSFCSIHWIKLNNSFLQVPPQGISLLDSCLIPKEHKHTVEITDGKVFYHRCFFSISVGELLLELAFGAFAPG